MKDEEIETIKDEKRKEDQLRSQKEKERQDQKEKADLHQKLEANEKEKSTSQKDFQETQPSLFSVKEGQEQTPALKLFQNARKNGSLKRLDEDMEIDLKKEEPIKNRFGETAARIFVNRYP